MATLNVLPYQIIAGVVKLYAAPVGEAFPAVGSDPAGNWVYLGHTDGGVKVGHPQTIVPLRTDQVTAPVKAVRSEEDLRIDTALAELLPANYALALNQLAATASGADEVITLYRGGAGVTTFALLCRGEQLSPLGAFNLQYEVPSVYQAGEPEVEYTKDAKAMLAVSFMAIAALAFEVGSLDSDIFGVLRVGGA